MVSVGTDFIYYDASSNKEVLVRKAGRNVGYCIGYS